MKRTSFLLLFVLMVLAVFSFGATGDRDKSFGSEGIVKTSFFPVGFQRGSSVALQPDGKVIAGGTYYSQQSVPSFGVMRYLANGAPDTGFGTQGKVLTQMGIHSFLTKITIQPDGKVVAVGYTYNNSILQPRYEFAVARYNPDGSPDLSFDGDGKVTTAFSGQKEKAFDAVLQPDGKLVIAGTGAGGSSGSLFTGFAAVRYNVNGSLDPTFDEDGMFVIRTGGDSGVAAAVSLQPDGKIVMAGQHGGGPNDYVFLRLKSNGAVDPTFNTTGIVTTSVSELDVMIDCAVLPDGKILAVGNSGGTVSTTYNVAVMRLNPDGSFDNAFGNGGRIHPLLTGEFHEASAFEVLPDNKFIVTGNTYTPGGYPQLSSRFFPDASIDPQYGENGKVFEQAGTSINSIAKQPDGKIVLSGTKFENNTEFFITLRYLANGARECDFDRDGSSDISVFRPSAGLWFSANTSAGYSVTQFGNSEDRVVPGDYDADGKTDLAVFRSGAWYILKSSDGTVTGGYFGTAGDLPVTADYDSDGKADLAVFRQGVWYIANSRDGSVRIEHFGIAGDRPVVGNFDGDSRSDLAVFRNGIWYINGSSSGFSMVQFGLENDKPIAADYDGDGKADIAVFRQGEWYLLRSHLGFTSFRYGLAGDMPVPADYDDDGEADRAVYRNGLWYVQTGTGGPSVASFGTTRDVPVQSAYYY